jgi:hypothetical protein
VGVFECVGLQKSRRQHCCSSSEVESCRGVFQVGLCLQTGCTVLRSLRGVFVSCWFFFVVAHSGGGWGYTWVNSI